MSKDLRDVEPEFEAALSRMAAMSPEELDAASDGEVRRMLEAVMSARAAGRLEAEWAARAAVEQAERARLDWGGHAPADPVPVAADTAAADRAAETDRERTRQPGLDPWAVHVAGVREAIAEGRMPRYPSAAEYRTWSDERIAALRLEPEQRLSRETGVDLLELGVDGYDPTGLLDASALDQELEDLDDDPLLYAVEQLGAAQRASNEADAQRVTVALAVWRTAEAMATGTAAAAMNSLYFKSTVTQIAHELQVAEQTASGLIHAADELEAKLPLTWRRFRGGEVPWRGMQKVHAAIDGLDEAFLPAFDEKAAQYVVDVATPKLKDRLHRLRERLQASTAVERHRTALQGMRVELEPAADGMAWLMALLPAAEAVQIDHQLDQAAREAAGRPDETRSIGQLRAVVFADVWAEFLRHDATADADDVLVPQRKGVQCRVGLLIPAMTAMGHSDEPAVLEGYGPIDIDTAKRLAGAAKSWIKVLTDPITGAVKDLGRKKYRPTADMRALLGILDGGGRGPNCIRPPSQTEADHVEPYRQGFARGRTALDNLVLLSRRDHRIKTSGLWDIELREGRDLAFTSYLGTRIITTVEPLAPTPVPDEFVHPPDVPDPPPDAPDQADADTDTPF